MPSTPWMVASTPGFSDPLKRSAWSSAQVESPLRYIPSTSKPSGNCSVHHGALGEREVLHVARQRDEHGLAGLVVDAGDRHRVGTQAPAAGTGVAAHQQHVVAAVGGARRRAVAEHRDHEVALHADDVGAEEQGAGDAEAEEAVDADDREAVLALQRQRLAEAPGVDEEVGPADRERHQPQAQHLQERRVGAGPEGEAVPEVRRDDQRARPTTTSAIHVRSAIRPTRRLPATSWADPGRTRVISIRVTARRNRTRCARSSVVNRVWCDPGGVDGRHRGPFCWGKSARPVSPVTPVPSGQRRAVAGRSADESRGRPSPRAPAAATSSVVGLPVEEDQPHGVGVGVVRVGSAPDQPETELLRRVARGDGCARAGRPAPGARGRRRGRPRGRRPPSRWRSRDRASRWSKR